MDHFYPFVNYPLTYPFQRMEPFIDIQTMYLHHDKHLQAYVDNTNQVLSQHPEWWKVSLEEMLTAPERLPDSCRTSICNNGGGIYNHQFFFAGMRNQGEQPQGRLLEQILRQYGSIAAFYTEWKKAALSVFGSGYAWLVTEEGDQLQIITTANQDTPLRRHLIPLMVIDVWEHAYYLKFKNLRGDYIDNWWQVINWERTGLLYEESCTK